jgi:dipeptidyl aminopeptidase/acylaminoacyl peptidase
VFDVGADAGVNYVVSELLEGETLRERLKSGPLPVRKAVDYAAQIAHGLAAAHGKGIVHRDLKPENLFITRDGRVKILDFGIAKLTAAPDRQTLAPTIDRGTTPGTILGTVGYMSPEQVRGLAVDYRTDIFSFGAILYEMLGGRRAFAGATEADTISAILNSDPPELSDPQRTMPPILDRLVRRCLEKNPDERFQSSRDLAFDLDAISSTSHAGVVAADVAAPRPRTGTSVARTLTAVALGILLGAGEIWTLIGRQRAPSVPARYRQLTFRRGTVQSARFSPDGETVVYSAAWEGRPYELYTTHTGAIGEQALGIKGGLLAVSKTGELAVLRDVLDVRNWIELGTLARAPLGGGAPREILRDVSGADWSPDGRELAVTRYIAANDRYRLEYPVGTVLLETDQWIESPRVSRDGTGVALLEHPATGDNRGRVITVTRDRVRAAISPEYDSIVGIAWASTGDEVWFTASDGGIQLHLFAVRPGTVPRPLVPMPANVELEDVLPNGRILVQTGTHKGRTLVKTPADKDERDFGWLDYGLIRDMSADGATVLFDEEGEGGGPNYSVFVRHTDGSPAIRLGDGYATRLSPDSQWVATQLPSALDSIILVPVGPGEPRKLTIGLPQLFGFPGWFPDGKRLALIGSEPGRPRRSFEYSIETGKLRPITPEGTTGALVSPDGRTLVAVRPDGSRIVLSLDGGADRPIPGLQPQDAILRWSGDGKSLFVSNAVAPRQRTIEELNLADGMRRKVVTISPSDTAGMRSLAPPLVSADGRTYAYRYLQVLSDLFVGDAR